MSPKSLFPLRASLRLAVLAFVAFGAASLRAEDVIVTGCVGSTYTGCPLSCPDSLGTMTLDSSYSTAVPAGANRSKTMFGTLTTSTWTVTPTLGTSSGSYKVYVSMGATYNCSADILVKIVASSGCTLADTNGTAAPSGLNTTAFQAGASLNVWTPVAIINTSTNKPTILFSWSAGACSRFYMDEVRFENVTGGTATPARITQIRYGSPVTISGTGPVSRPFALASCTNFTKWQWLTNWTAEQTNTDGVGSFSFTVTPGTEKARLFRVITQ